MTARHRSIVRAGRLLQPGGEMHRPPPADILIEDGRILAVEPPGRITTDAEVIDAGAHLVVPGFVNAHYHSHDVLMRGLSEQLPLEVWGLQHFPSSYPRRDPEEVRVRTLLGAAENLLSGTTTVQDMVSVVGPDRAHVDALREAYRASGARALVALQYGDRASVDTVPFWRSDLSEAAKAQLGGALDPAPMQAFVAEIVGSAGGARLSWGLGPSAPQRCSEGLLRWFAALSREASLQVFTHLYETRSQAVLARTDYAAEGHSLVGFLDRMGLLNERLTIAHGVWITPEEVARLGAAGAHLSCNLMSNLKLLNGVAPIRLYAEHGAGLALGCDNCSGNDAQNMFESMKCFALWWGLSGEAGETGAAIRAFDAATTGSARALGLAGEVGTITPGARADLVMIRLDDPAMVPLNSAVRQLVYAAGPRAVDTVLVEGETVVRDGRVVSFDLAAAQREATAWGERLCACHRDVVARFARTSDEILAIHRRIACEPLPINRLRFGPEG